jgi:hypothetical protein
MSNLPKSTPSRVILLDASTTALAVSDPVRRDNFTSHTFYAAHDDATVGTSTVDIQACGRDPVRETDWVTIAAAQAVPFHISLADQNIFAVRAVRKTGTRPLTVLVNSNTYSR